MPHIGVALLSNGAGKDVPSIPLVALAHENNLTSPLLCSFWKIPLFFLFFPLEKDFVFIIIFFKKK